VAPGRLEQPDSEEERTVALAGSIRRRWKRWAVAAGAGVLVLVVGVPFVYIHFIEGPAPAPLTLSAGSTATTVDPAATAGRGNASGPSTGDTAPVDGVWKVTSGSQAGYRIGETLFGQSATAVGRTTAVTGTITISGTTVDAGSFSVDMTKVTSDESQRDNQFQGRIMDTAAYPTATLVLIRPVTLATLPAEGVLVTESATGRLTMHGTTRAVTFQVTARRTGTTIQVSGAIPVTFADWNIANPSGGPATTQDHGTLEFLLDLARS
jgi:polyisoprenoid-binding protein YceI